MKNSLARRINNTLLQNPNFQALDFSIRDDYRGPQLLYNYSDKKYYFQFKLPSESKVIEVEKKNNLTKKVNIEEEEIYEFTGTFSPGKYNESETFKVNSFEKVLSKISDWQTYLHGELISSYAYREIELRDIKIEEIRKSIDEKFSKMEFENKNEYLTKEEAKEIIERLSELEKEIEDILKIEIENQDNQKHELELLHLEFKLLKDTTKSLNKQNWMMRLITSISNWGLDPNNQKKFIVGSKLLIKMSTAIGLPVPNEVSLLLDSNGTSEE